MSRIKAVLLGSLALAASVLVVPAPASPVSTPSVTTTTSTDGRTTVSVATVTVQRETEKDRYRRLKGQRGYRLLYPATHRSPGDRAHKRWKQRQRAGGAA